MKHLIIYSEFKTVGEPIIEVYEKTLLNNIEMADYNILPEIKMIQSSFTKKNKKLMLFVYLSDGGEVTSNLKTKSFMSKRLFSKYTQLLNSISHKVGKCLRDYTFSRRQL